MMHKNIRQNSKTRFLLLFYLPLIAIFLLTFMAYINASIEECKKRDVKGLYKKAEN